jgi:penicillin-binding protein A
MMRRVTTGAFLTRLRIPRKGRIRVALALVLVAGVAVILRRHGPAAGATPVFECADSVAGQDESPAAQPERETSLPPEPRPAPGGYSSQQVTDLVRRHSPRLTAPADTISVWGRSLTVHYTIDTLLQRYGRTLLGRYHPKYGAVVLLDARSGRVLAMVSYTNEGEPFLGRNLACRAYFPAASIFKVVTAAGSVEKGSLGPQSELHHAGRNHTLYNFQLERELKQSRLVTLADAFAYSYNPVFGRLGIYVLGREGLHQYAERFGFGAVVPFELAVDSAVLGTCDSVFDQAEVASGFNQQTSMSPLLGALMAGAVVDGGAMMRPHLVDSITDTRGGERLYRANAALWRSPIRASTATAMCTLMENVVRYGTARRSFAEIKRWGRSRELELGGKTGNVDRDGIGRVDWFVGYVRDTRDGRASVAAGVVTVHGQRWTVHSGYIAAELFRTYIRQRDRAARGAGRDDG